MVFHARRQAQALKKKKIDLAKLAPYALHLAMVLAVAVYVVVGAFAIRHIEATPKNPEGAVSRFKRDQSHVHDIRRLSANRTRKCILTAIEKITKHTNCSKLEDSSYLELLDDCYEHDLKKLLEAAKHRKKEHQERKQLNEEKSKSASNDGEEYDYWSIMDSVLFCFTVITTIGYGNVAPRSFHGRLFVILYGLVGVPFTMLALANLGKFLATVLKTWSKPFVNCLKKIIKKCCGRSYTAKEKQRLMEKESKQPNKIIDDDSEDGNSEGDEDDDGDDATTDGIILFLSFVVYIVVGSIVIAAYEPNMDFFEAIYFNFVTLTTIGLGDLVPQSETYLAITLIYCAIGLALTTIAIEIAADALKKLHYFGRKVDNVANVQVWFGGKKISMKALVKNLGDQFNVPVDELEKLNIDKFVDDAMRVQQGELATLREEHVPKHVTLDQNRDWMNSNYWRAIESGSMHYVDDDDLVTLRSNRCSYNYLLQCAASQPTSPYVEITDHAPFLPTPIYPSSQYASIFDITSVPVLEKPDFLAVNPSFVCETDDLTIFIDDPTTSLESQKPNSEVKAPTTKQSVHDRWSEEARRRYEQYQQTWKRYRTTKKGPR